MKTQMILLILFFAFQGNFIMSMQPQRQQEQQHQQYQPSAPYPDQTILMHAQVNASYSPAYSAHMMQAGYKVGTVALLQHQEGLVIAASNSGYKHQNVAGANTAYFFNRVTGLFSGIGALQEGYIYEFKNNQLKQILRKNKIESCREIVAGFCESIVGLAKNNVPVHLAACAGCARSAACLAWVLGKTASTPQYLAGYFILGFCSVMLSRVSKIETIDQNIFPSLAGVFGALVGMHYR